MKALLSQLALVMGGLVAAVSLALNLSRGMDLLTSVFRATLVFFATVIVLFLFLRFFSMILVRFVAEQVLQNRPPEEGEAGGEAAGGGRNERAAASPRTRGSAP